jgi:predicted ABC-type ATPase
MTISDEPRSPGAVRLHAIAAELTEIGWKTHLYRTGAGTDLTATLHPRGHRDIQVIADEDGYTELRYWASLVSTPGAVVAAIADILDTLLASQSLAERAGPTRGPVAGYDGAVTERAEGSGMTGPHDHLAEQGHLPDQAGPRSADDPHETHMRPDDLQARLERLPLNHPSSPYRDDGSRKPQPPDLAKYELPLPDEQEQGERDLQTHIEPLTDAEYAEHVQEVREHLGQARADGLTTDALYTIEPDREIWSDEREAFHDAIIDDLYARAINVPNEHEAIIAGGLPGAGKSTVLENYAGVDRSRFLTIDPDEIKKELAQRGLIPTVEGLSPMEASDLAHEESSYVAKGLAQRAQAEGKNMVWDITMSSRSSTESRIEDLRSAGYTRVVGIFVDIPLEKSEVRAEARHRIGQDEYRTGKGEGGRFLLPEVIRSNADPFWGSLNRKVFEEVKHRFEAWSIYDNSIDGRPPVLTDSSEGKEEP